MWYCLNDYIDTCIYLQTIKTSVISLQHDITGRALIRINDNTLLRMGITNKEHRDAIWREILKLRLKTDIMEIRDLERRHNYFNYDLWHEQPLTNATVCHRCALAFRSFFKRNTSGYSAIGHLFRALLIIMTLNRFFTSNR